ncbi:MAG: winged helix-turn-helix transcriptional regulator [Saprospiraceae bacterium]|nr:winged helix-turn-helix transcriptional regulator [Candidatus Defluviibacterium haderslevense]
MSAKRKQMHQIKIIFQMKMVDHSIRNIVKQTGMSRNTVRDYLRRLQDSGLGYEAALALSDEELSNLLSRSSESQIKQAYTRCDEAVNVST